MRATLDRGVAIEALLWATSVGALAIAAWGARWSPATVSESAGLPAPSVLAAPIDAAALARMRDGAIARDAFRLLRRASPIGFTASAPEQAMGISAMQMRPPKPVLVLRGVVGGPPWEALLDGVPGRERGVVVRSGDVLGPSVVLANGSPAAQMLHVRRISADGVVITGMDTTWRLRVAGNADAAQRAP